MIKNDIDTHLKDGKAQKIIIIAFQVMFTSGLMENCVEGKH